MTPAFRRDLTAALLFVSAAFGVLLWVIVIAP